MNQVWNIFRKDSRHHWREATVSIALMAVFVWIETRNWGGLPGRAAANTFASGFFADEFLSGLAEFLLPVSWIFLVVRAVHGESLVGDRQFWVTRPYDWRKLLTAKVLFVLAFVNLPLFIADVFLLAKAGFRPAAYLPGLFWMQALWIIVLLVPTAAFASMTAGIGQMLLALLFLALYFFCMSALAGVIPNSAFSEGIAPVYFFAAIAALLAVIFLQYSRRKTRQSRSLVIGVAAALVLVLTATPYRTLIAHHFPLASEANFPLHVGLLPSHAPGPDEAMQFGNLVPVKIPLSLSGLPKDSFVELNGGMLDLSNSAGSHWESHWQPRSELLFPDQETANIQFYLKKQDFDRIKSSPASARLLLAFTLFHDRNQRPLVVPHGAFSLPEVGLCGADSNPSSPLYCRAPLHGPTFLLVTANAGASTCPLAKGETALNSHDILRNWVRNADPGPAELGISPVHDFTVSLADRTRSPTPWFIGICPGTPLILSNPEEGGSYRVELQVDNLSLTDYRMARPD